MEKELIIKVKDLESYHTLFRGGTIVDNQNRETRTIFKDTYDTTFFEMKKVLRKTKMIVEGNEEYILYDKLLREEM